MASKSLIYRNAFFYFLGLRLLHKCDISLRNKFIAGLVNKDETVLEPGCGPGTLANYLPSDIHYVGFDLNESFVSYGLKKGRNLYLGDVLKENSYQKADVVVVCDILHHIKLEDRKTFIKHSYSYAKRLFIFCDCIKEKEGLLRKVMYPINSRLFELLDKDGINEPKYRELYTKRQLQMEIENGFGIIPKNTRKVVRQFGCDLVVVYYKSA